MHAHVIDGFLWMLRAFLGGMVTSVPHYIKIMIIICLRRVIAMRRVGDLWMNWKFICVEPINSGGV
jgi:hypothetical protein